MNWKIYFIACSIFCILNSCTTKNKDTDPQGRLRIESLKAESGSLNFSPMQHSDSASVNTFKPQKLLYSGKPYSGSIASYNEHDTLIIDGHLTDGIADNVWTFYYPSGVVQMKGTYSHGLESGLWESYYSRNKLNIVKYYDANGYMLMRTEYYDSQKIKNYQNIKCPQFGNIARRLSFDYTGKVTYADAEDSVIQLPAANMQEIIKRNGFMQN